MLKEISNKEANKQLSNGSRATKEAGWCDRGQRMAEGASLVGVVREDPMRRRHSADARQREPCGYRGLRVGKP